MTEVLAVASEVYPLIKTGGLADVAGALPAALKPHDINVRTLIPGYPQVMAKLGATAEAARLDNFHGGPVRLLSGKVRDLELFVLDAPHLFNRSGGPYSDTSGVDWPDNWRRFAALGDLAGQLARGLVPAYRPAIVHAHDWQAALAPAHLRYNGSGGARSVLTIHNLAFQGQFAAQYFPALGLPAVANGLDGVEYYGGIGFLKGGLVSADAITTVSPTYAREIRTPEFGMGLDGLLNQRLERLHGIVNGIDIGEWNPSADAALAATFTVAQPNLRAANKRAVEARFGLETGEGPILAAVTRLTWQKGIDIIADCADRLVALGGRLAVLGSGEAALEKAISAAAAKHPGKIGVVIGYDENLSHLLQGGADCILVPSRFEPCGLTQLYGLRYGCVPVVSRVGGLNDTVIDANDAALDAGVATGFQFAPLNALALGDAFVRVMALYADQNAWRKMQRRGMKSDVSWTKSAARYADLFRSLLAE